MLYIVINKMCMPNVCHFSHRVFSTHFEFRYLTYIICIQKKPNCMFMFCLDFLTIQLLFGLQEGPYRIVFAWKFSYHCHPSLPCLSPAPVERFDDVHIFSANGVHWTSHTSVVIAITIVSAVIRCVMDFGWELAEWWKECEQSEELSCGTRISG